MRIALAEGMRITVMLIVWLTQRERTQNRHRVRRGLLGMTKTIARCVSFI